MKTVRWDKGCVPELDDIGFSTKLRRLLREVTRVHVFTILRPEGSRAMWTLEKGSCPVSCSPVRIPGHRPQSSKVVDVGVEVVTGNLFVLIERTELYTCLELRPGTTRHGRTRPG